MDMDAHNLRHMPVFREFLSIWHGMCEAILQRAGSQFTLLGYKNTSENMGESLCVRKREGFKFYDNTVCMLRGVLSQRKELKLWIVLFVDILKYYNLPCMIL
ncbi:uncharacterized protein LOC142231370 [Haematobia irritans]|uniref:uncharacterized protein LOC142231370 n=1 Tax=Haematobia irritans TaxID=7368 RepID=UPI003F4F6519